MRKVFIKDILSQKLGENVQVMGWISSKRIHKTAIFLQVSDSSGTVQVVVTKNSPDFAKSKNATIESGIVLLGKLRQYKFGKEVECSQILEIYPNQMTLSPTPREDFDIFAEHYTDLVLKNKHLYIRNPKTIAILQFRDFVLRAVRDWFFKNKFISLEAPILTPLPLYTDGSAMSITVHEENMFLTQCVGFYLESTVHALDRIYNIGPSFRAEESRSKRHLMEYWHIKAELTFGDLDQMIEMVESLINHISMKVATECGRIFETLGTKPCLDGTRVPYPRITYRDAVELLRSKGYEATFGTSLSSKDEEVLSEHFNGMVWVTGIPRLVEPFPYVIDPNDSEVCVVADLVASRGYGELLGTAEKIYNYAMLEQRMKDKNKFDDPRYEWVKEVHQMGCVPHIAFGMGVERLLRWLLQIPHVRDCIAFPRIFRRSVYP